MLIYTLILLPRYALRLRVHFSKIHVTPLRFADSRRCFAYARHYADIIRADYYALVTRDA